MLFRCLRRKLVPLLLLGWGASPASSAAVRSPDHLQAPVALGCDGYSEPLAVAESNPSLSWKLEAAEPSLRGVRQTEYRVLVASSRAILAHDRGDLWDSGVVKSSATFGIPYGGQSLASSQQVFWKVRVWDESGHASGWSAPATWTSAPALSAGGATFAGARWIAAPDASERDGADHPMPIFRHEFTLEKPVRRAVLQVSGMGQDQVRLNGRAVNAGVLAPGWSDFRKTVFFDTYDVSALVQRGANVIGILLGNGMYNVQHSQGRYTKFAGSFGVPKCIALLRVEFADGSVATFATDSHWQTAPGPITFSSTYGGEDFDARREEPAWDRPGFAAGSSWKPAVEADGPGGVLMPELAPPVRVMKTYTPVRQSALRPGVTVYDLGENFAGWPEIDVRGAPGAAVRITPGELLARDGSVTQRSSGSDRAPSYFQFTLRGEGLERWHPLFSYYGFRYLEVALTAAPRAAALPQVQEVLGEAVHSSRAPSGTFHSSSEILNRLHDLILHAMENNTVSLFTDCPHREKLGWLEETQLMASPLLWNADLRGVYAATGRNIADTQKADGMVPTIAPQYTEFQKPYDYFNDSPEWGSAAVLAPWMLYQRYGDRAALRRAWPVMQRYTAYLRTRAAHGIVAYGLGDWYDIGPGNPGLSTLTTLGVTATATFYQDLIAMRDAARVLGETGESTSYDAEAAEVKTAFQSRFWDPQQQRYDRGSQTAQAMPLALGMTPEALRARTLEVLIADIRAHNDHVTAGEIGFPYLVRTLIENHRGDVLLAMLERTDPPSYGSQLAAGATALTEAWDANPHSSQDHFMLGYGDDWFYRGLGGLDLDLSRAPGDNLRIDPEMTASLGSANITYDSILGEIETHWAREASTVRLRVVIPANVEAWVRVDPTAREDGVSAASARGVVRTRRDETGFWLLLGSGDYSFSWREDVTTAANAPR